MVDRDQTKVIEELTTALDQLNIRYAIGGSSDKLGLRELFERAISRSSA